MTIKTKNLWDTVKVVLRLKFISIQAHIKKQESHQLNNLTLLLKQVKQKEPKKKKKKGSRRKEIMKIIAEIHKKEMKET